MIIQSNMDAWRRSTRRHVYELVLILVMLCLVAAGFLFFTHRSNLRQFFASRSETERTQS